MAVTRHPIRERTVIAAPEVSDSDYSDDEIVPKSETSEWQTVERKIRVKRDKVQEALDNNDAPVEDEEESAWNDQPEEHETYWDERHH